MIEYSFPVIIGMLSGFAVLIMASYFLYSIVTDTP